MKGEVAIIDYGVGNLRSVQQAFRYLDVEVHIISDPDHLESFTHLVLPGVGSYRRGMLSLKERNLDKAICQQVGLGKPLLGICLGMQLLAQRSSEDGETTGLGLINGDVDKFSFNPSESELKIPNVGFSSIEPVTNSNLFNGLGEQVDFYFTHSYRLQSEDKEAIAATSWHGESYVAAIEKGSLVGTQFHPEKSQANGLKLLKNFIEKF